MVGFLRVSSTTFSNSDVHMDGNLDWGGSISIRAGDSSAITERRIVEGLSEVAGAKANDPRSVQADNTAKTTIMPYISPAGSDIEGRTESKPVTTIPMLP